MRDDRTFKEDLPKFFAEAPNVLAKVVLLHKDDDPEKWATAKKITLEKEDASLTKVDENQVKEFCKDRAEFMKSTLTKPTAWWMMLERKIKDALSMAAKMAAKGITETPKREVPGAKADSPSKAAPAKAEEKKSTEADNVTAKLSAAE